jgi:hypothetical protein
VAKRQAPKTAILSFACPKAVLTYPHFRLGLQKSLKGCTQALSTWNFILQIRKLIDSLVNEKTNYMFMKKQIALLVAVAGLTTIAAQAQTSGVAVTTLSCMQTQVVTLTCGAPQFTNNSTSYNLSANQIVTLNTFPTETFTTALITFYDGTSIYAPSSSSTQASQQAFVFTGASNITFSITGNATAKYVSDLLTFTVLTHSTNTVTYTPANSVVIPTDATGPVQIILQSSSDLVNWIPSLPGTYGNTYSNRFFRVIAVAQ